MWIIHAVFWPHDVTSTPVRYHAWEKREANCGKFSFWYRIVHTDKTKWRIRATVIDDLDNYRKILQKAHPKAIWSQNLISIYFDDAQRLFSWQMFIISRWNTSVSLTMLSLLVLGSHHLTRQRHLNCFAVFLRRITKTSLYRQMLCSSVSPKLVIQYARNSLCERRIPSCLLWRRKTQGKFGMESAWIYTDRVQTSCMEKAMEMKWRKAVLAARKRRKSGKHKREICMTLTSLCIVSHHPFFSTFRECLFFLRKLIDTRVGEEKFDKNDNFIPGLHSWSVLTCSEDPKISPLAGDIEDVETWVQRLLQAPSAIPGRTRVEVELLPPSSYPPLSFALPESYRFPLIDFPVHIPFELLGVETCLKVLTCILLEHKVLMFVYLFIWWNRTFDHSFCTVVSRIVVLLFQVRVICRNGHKNLHKRY